MHTIFVELTDNIISGNITMLRMQYSEDDANVILHSPSVLKELYKCANKLSKAGRLSTPGFSYYFFSMAHPKDSEIYPLNTVIARNRTGEYAIIRNHTSQVEGREFLNYLVEIEGREGPYPVS